MSERRSAGFPRACSGDMYAAVPRITPALVPSNVIVGEFAVSTGTSGAAAFANPKSRIFTTPSGVTLMLAGFRSR